jgi:rhamnosyltransferase
VVKIAGVIVLYSPDKSVINNIKSYLDDIDILYAVDNSEAKNDEINNAIKALDKVTYIDNNGNQGIANALNVGAKRALQEKYEWLLTMDQDSSFDPLVFNQYLQCALSIPSLESIAIIAPNFLAKPKGKITRKHTEELTVITSGNLLNLRLYNVIGGFNEKLFIDEVDNEYCLKAYLANFTIVKFDDVYLKHQLGSVQEIRLSKKMQHRTIHTQIRHYYIGRNFLYIFFSFRKQFPTYVYYRLWRVTRTLIFVMIFWPKKIRRFKFIPTLGIDEYRWFF